MKRIVFLLLVIFTAVVGHAAGREGWMGLKIGHVRASVPGGNLLYDYMGDLNVQLKRDNTGRDVVLLRMKRKAAKVRMYLRWPLHDLTLKQTLDIFTRVCDPPIEYVVVDDTIVFQLADERKVAAGKKESGDGNRIRARLAEVKLSYAQYGGKRLGEVVQELVETTREQRINFLFLPTYPTWNHEADPNTAILPGLGVDPRSPEAAPDFGLMRTRLNLELPLREVTAADAIDALVELAEEPIRCTVEDYGVVFELIHKIPVVPAVIDVDPRILTANLAAFAGEPISSDRPMLSLRLRSYLLAAGVRSMDQKFQSRLFVDRNKKHVRVHALKEDLPRIRKLIGRLNSPAD